jgi:hypothetical protein
MLGLGKLAGWTITPKSTGIIFVCIAMVANNGTIGDGTTITGKGGTGTAPANGAVATGTTIGSPQTFIGSTAAGFQGVTIVGIITGALNTAIWFDCDLVAVAGTANLKALSLVAFEI